MGTLDKEIRVIAVKGERGTDGQDGVDGQDGADGKSSYELAIENELFSGTLEEWINTFATPENYITRSEFQKVTQAQYDALKLAGELTPNCYYLIIDSTDAEDFEQLKTDVSNLDDDINDPTTGLKARVSANETTISTKVPIEKSYQATSYTKYENSIENNNQDIQLQSILINSNTDIRKIITITISNDNVLFDYKKIDEGTIVSTASLQFDYTGTLTLYDGSNTGALTPVKINKLDNLTLYRHDIKLSASVGDYVGYIYIQIVSNLSTQITNQSTLISQIGSRCLASGYLYDNTGTHTHLSQVIALEIDNGVVKGLKTNYPASDLNPNGNLNSVTLTINSIDDVINTITL